MVLHRVRMQVLVEPMLLEHGIGRNDGQGENGSDHAAERSAREDRQEHGQRREPHPGHVLERHVVVDALEDCLALVIRN